METWLVTGSAGFLGCNTGLWLTGKAHRVGISRGLRDPSLFDEQVVLDMRDQIAFADAARASRPNVILHAAAISGHVTCANDPEQALAVNVKATQVISDVATEIGARLIYISSDAVFPGEAGNYSETDPVAPFSYYGETKLAAEEIVRATVPDALILRTNFFGWSVPGDQSVLEFFVNSLRAGQQIHGYPDSVVTSIYVRSLIETIWQLNELGTTGTVHVASRDALSKHDFGVAVARQFGLDPDLIAAQPSAVKESTTSRSRDISLDTSLLASLLGSPPPTQSAGIRRAFEDESSVRAVLQRGEGSA
jgi:dTDP-4-dehydrorhamnose reductase